MDIKQGQSTTLTAIPLDASGNPTTLPSGDVPQWSVDTPTSVSVVPGVDGLTLAVKVNPTAPAGDIVFQITDALIPSATGKFTLTLPALPPNPVASFSVTASTPV